MNKVRRGGENERALGAKGEGRGRGKVREIKE